MKSKQQTAKGKTIKGKTIWKAKSNKRMKGSRKWNRSRNIDSHNEADAIIFLPPIFLSSSFCCLPFAFCFSNGFAQNRFAIGFVLLIQGGLA